MIINTGFQVGVIPTIAEQKPFKRLFIEFVAASPD
jgi:hypothetical protein